MHVRANRIEGMSSLKMNRFILLACIRFKMLYAGLSRRFSPRDVRLKAHWHTTCGIKVVDVTEKGSIAVSLADEIQSTEQVFERAGS
jgi:hypothetical protein